MRKKKQSNWSAIILVIVLIIVFSYMLPENGDALQTDGAINQNQVNNVVNNVMNQAKNEVKNTEKENTTKNEVQNTVEKDDNQQVDEKEEKEEKQEDPKEEIKTETNAAQTGDADRQKAINMAKKEWGEDENVSFKVDEQTENGKYTISVVDKSTTKVIFWYSVDVKNNTIEEM